MHARTHGHRHTHPHTHARTQTHARTRSLNYKQVHKHVLTQIPKYAYTHTPHLCCISHKVMHFATAAQNVRVHTKCVSANHLPTSTQVRLKEYGSDMIEVSDNGSGVKEEDYQALTLKYHTSKLQQFTDLTVCAMCAMCVLSGCQHACTHHTQCTHTRTHTMIHIHKHTRTHAHTHAHTHYNTHTQTHTHARTHTHAHTHTTIHIHKHTQALGTFGFRGEALSSLCALAELSVVTRTASQDVGARLEYDHGGRLVQQV